MTYSNCLLVMITVGIPPIPDLGSHDDTDPYSDFGIDHLDHFLNDFQMVF